MYSWLSGTAISGALVGELWSAVSEMKRYRSREVVEYSKAVESFLQSWLPLSGKTLDESAELVVAGVRATADMSFSRVFRSNSSTGDSKNSLRISASTHYSPLVQGPIARTGSVIYTSPTYCGGGRYFKWCILPQELRRMLTLPAGLWIFASRRAMLSLLHPAVS